MNFILAHRLNCAAAIGAPHPKVRCWSDPLVSHQSSTGVSGTVIGYCTHTAQHTRLAGGIFRRVIVILGAHFLYSPATLHLRARSCVITNNDGVFVYKSRVQSADKSRISNCCERAEERKMKTADGKVRRMGFLFKSLQRDASGEHNASWNIIYNITHTDTQRKRDINDLDW